MAPADGGGLRSLAQRALKRTAAIADRIQPPGRGVVVLIYHRVGGDSGLELDLPAVAFAEQMAYLAERGVTSDLDDALDALDGNRLTDHAPHDDHAPGHDPVVVTFDDGTRDFAEVAVPELVRHGIPATLYLATAFVDQARELPYGAPPVSWNGLRDALATGLVTVGSHTHTHALLDRLPAPQVAHELDESCRLIEDELGVTPAHFAYPKALPGSAAADAAVRKRFRSAALAGTRPNRYGHADRYRLARSPIQASDGARWFRAKVAGGMGLEDGVRSTVNRLRYRDAAS